MWGPILGGFTILGVFLTLSAWINGRSIKRYIGELIKGELKATRELIEKETTATRELIKEIREETTATRELIKEEARAAREILAKLSDQHESMIRFLQK